MAEIFCTRDNKTFGKVGTYTGVNTDQGNPLHVGDYVTVEWDNGNRSECFVCFNNFLQIFTIMGAYTTKLEDILSRHKIIRIIRKYSQLYDGYHYSDWYDYMIRGSMPKNNLFETEE